MCGEGGACVVKGDMHGKGSMCGKGGMHGRRGDMHGKGGCMQKRWPLKRAVHILLECILVTTARVD